MEKQKTRKLGIRFKIIIPTTISLIIMAAVMSFNSYSGIKKGMIDVGGEQALMAAKYTHANIDGDALAAFYASDGTDEESYNKVLAQMTEARDEIGIRFMYTLYEDGGTVYYGVDSDMENPCDYGEEFSIPYEELEPVFSGSTYSENELVEEDGESLITSYAPIKSSDGTIIGIVGCDYNAKEISSRIATTLRNIILTSVICLIIVIAVLNIIIESMMRNLNAVNSKIYEIVYNEGDLTRTVDVHSGDELENIAGNVNALIKYIRTIMTAISGNSMSLTDSVRNVVNNLGAAKSSISDVSATMTQMSAAMEETSASLSLVNDSVNSTYTAVEGISQTAQSGSDNAEQILQRVQMIYDDAHRALSEAQSSSKAMSENVYDKIEKSKSVQEISTLTDNILSIAQQTNLLALNASIEAARAGDAGRGFSVVAGEIGTLANTSSEAATRIQQVSKLVIDAVTALAEESNRMVEFMDVTAINGYNKLFETCENYKNDMSEISEIMKNFTDESSKVRQSMDSIRDSVESINAAVNESAHGVENVTERSVELQANVSDIDSEANANRDISDALNSEVKKFRL